MKYDREFDDETGIITITCDVNDEISKESIVDGQHMTPMMMSVKGWKRMALKFLLEDDRANKDDLLDKNLAQLEKAIICEFCAIRSTPLVRKLDGKVIGWGDSDE